MYLDQSLLHPILASAFNTILGKRKPNETASTGFLIFEPQDSNKLLECYHLDSMKSIYPHRSIH